MTTNTKENRTMKTRVLVTGAGGAAAISVLKALEGPDTVLFAADIDPHAAGLYLVPEEHRVLVPRGDDPAFVDACVDACVSLGAFVLIPTVDVELVPLARARARFEKFGIQVMVPDADALERSLDKLAFARALETHLPAPRTELLDEGFALHGWELPVIAKPRAGSGGRGVCVVRRAEDLAPLPRDGSYLVQEMLPGEEYSVDVLVDRHGRCRIAVPRARLKVDSGVAVAARTLHDPVLEHVAARAVERLGLTGPLNVQLRRDVDGTARLLEVNPRFPGTLPLTIAAGVDLPRLALDDLLGRPLDVPADFEDVAIVRTWQEHFVAPDAFERTPKVAPRPAEAA